MYKTKREAFDQVSFDLKLQRYPYEPHWQDVATYLAPYRFRLSTWDANRGERKNSKIINSAASLALRSYKSGMTAHNTSASRPWLGVSVPDQDLAEYGPVKWWTDQVSEFILDSYGRGNIYKNFPTFYGDQAGFSNACLWVEEDVEDVINTSVPMCGSYWYGRDHRGRVNAIYREFRMTVRQIVGRFALRAGNKIDWSVCSAYVKNLWDTKYFNSWIDVCHIVMPNDEADPSKLGAMYKRFTSCYYERGTGQDAGGGYQFNGSEGETFLEESGYDMFPALIGAGELSGEDTYGIDCPGMLAIGDVRELQYGERKIGKAIDKELDPPLVGPPELRGREVWGIPGKITHLAEREGQKGLRPIYQVEARIDHMEARQTGIVRRIDEAFYVDFFRMLASMDRTGRDITATEINARQEEKIAQLEPTISGNNWEVFGPLVDRTFAIGLKQGLLPPPPKELQGQRLKIEYISTMAQMLKALGLASIERVSAFTLNIAKQYPQSRVGDKVNWDQAVDEVASRSGAPGRIIVPDEVVAAIRQKQDQAAAAAQQAQQAESLTKSAQTLSQTDTSGKNALTDISDAMARNGGKAA